MGFDTVITNGTVVTATDTYKADVAVEGGRVVAMGATLPRENATRLIDAADKYVFPGRDRCPHPPGYAIWRHYQRG